MVTFEKFYEFMRAHYKHSRFEARNQEKYWGADYSVNVARRYYDELKRNGKGSICHHDSMSGEEVCFDSDLNLINQDAPPVERSSNTGNLTHLF